MPTAILSVYNKTGLVDFANASRRAWLDFARIRRHRQTFARELDQRH